MKVILKDLNWLLAYITFINHKLTKTNINEIIRGFIICYFISPLTYFYINKLDQIIYDNYKVGHIIILPR